MNPSNLILTLNVIWHLQNHKIKSSISLSKTYSMQKKVNNKIPQINNFFDAKKIEK